MAQHQRQVHALTRVFETTNYVEVNVTVFGEKSHNTWEFISKTDLSLDKIDKKYILKKSILHCLLYMF